MPHINPFVGLFAALVAALAAFVVPVFLLLRADIAEVRGEVAEVRGEVAEVRGEVAGNAERLTRIEAVVDALAEGQAEHGQRLTRIEAVQSEHGQRLTRIEAILDGFEAGQSEHGARLGRIEDGQTAVRGDLSATNERLARVEGTVAGVLARAFPERMAQAPEPEAGAGG